jgi:uncharacterized protein YcsI (UPF0317 family)
MTNKNPMSNPAITPADFRALCRSGAYRGPSAGVATGFVQANLVIVPKDWAFEFLLFCQRNPKPCPLVEVLDAGKTEPSCAPGADLRSDLPAYRVYRNGKLVEETGDISGLWQDDLVSFLIGCSFSFEAALMADGIALRHITEGKNVAMYRTSVQCVPAGRLSGPLVVSMRPIKSPDVARAAEISGRFPEVHGAPVHVGHPEQIGIKHLDKPDYGDAVEIKGDELPVFWACGVTPQSIAEASGIPFCITHAPGSMFVTDALMRG